MAALATDAGDGDSILVNWGAIAQRPTPERHRTVTVRAAPISGESTLDQVSAVS